MYKGNNLAGVVQDLGLVCVQLGYRAVQRVAAVAREGW